MLKPAFAILCAAGFAQGQTPAKAVETLQALLDEVHQLRQSIDGMTVASQRVQIALHAMQLQDGAVARSSQRLNAARSRCQGLEIGRQHTLADLQRLEQAVATGTMAAAEAAVVKQQLADLRTRMESQTVETQSCQVTESEALAQFRTDQAKLQELQNRIARLDKALEELGTRK